MFSQVWGRKRSKTCRKRWGIMKILFNMQISTFNDTFNIKIFACKCIWYVDNKHLQRKRSQPWRNESCWAVFNSAVWQTAWSQWFIKHPCSAAQFTHLLFESVQFLFVVFCEQWNNVEHLNSSSLTSGVFQRKRLGRTPLKAASAAQDPLLPASSPFGPCAAPSAVPPRHELGWREDANWFSASFPHWRPSSIAGTLQGTDKDTVLGHCSPASKFETRQKIRQIPPTEQGKH